MDQIEPISEFNEIDEQLLLNDETEEIFDELILEDSEDLLTITAEVPTETETEDSKHKIKGKHALSYDSIFKGKKEDDENDEESPDFLIARQSKNDFDTSSLWSDDLDEHEYIRLKKLKEQMYDLIITKTNINIKSSRRKPSKIDFNTYIDIMYMNLDMSTYSYTEVFVELAYYFSDTIENVFKLLDKKWGGKISTELARKANIKIDDFDFL